MTLFSLQIMQPEHSDEHVHIVSYVTPGHALSMGHPPFYFGPDAINFAALDSLVNFTGKVAMKYPLHCDLYLAVDLYVALGSENDVLTGIKVQMKCVV